MDTLRTITGTLFFALALAACAESAEQSAPEDELASAEVTASADCDDPALRDLVQRFGASLRQVSLLAPDTVVAAEMREAYGEMVTPELLADWIAEPSSAPGRDVSSPWPQRIEIAGIDTGDADTCLVRGEVVFVTSADTTGASGATRQRVKLTVTDGDGWRISGYEKGEGAAADSAAADTVAP